MNGLKQLRTSLGWKLLASYLVVIVVGAATMTIAAESVTPVAFERHMRGMQGMMGGQPMGMQRMETDLYNNFQAAVTEALLLATGAALVSAVAVSLFVAHRVITPIRQLTQASSRLAAGHYRERVSEASQDELGQLAHSFNQMAAALEQTEAMRRDLIANVAHELRTPLTSIKGYMEGLIDGVLPAEPGTYQQVYREADRLQRFVNDLQELSRVEAGAFELEPAPLAVAELIEQAADRLRPQFEEKQISLKLELPADLPPVRADEDRLSQILLNLMGNALQYTAGPGAVTVTAEYPAGPATRQVIEVPEGQVVITVQDTGLGIPAEHLPHLFTRFYRVDKSRSRVGGGSGIGLTITRHLVEAHGGRIGVHSAGEGEGSVFAFSLPVVRA